MLSGTQMPGPGDSDLSLVASGEVTVEIVTADSHRDCDVQVGLTVTVQVGPARPEGRGFQPSFKFAPPRRPPGLAPQAAATPAAATATRTPRQVTSQLPDSDSRGRPRPGPAHWQHSGSA